MRAARLPGSFSPHADRQCNIVVEWGPFYDYVTLPICMWAKAAWKPGCPDRQMTVAFDYALKHPDDDINGLAGRGPAHAALQALRRLGWKAYSAFHWESRAGQYFDIRQMCPSSCWLLVMPRLC